MPIPRTPARVLKAGKARILMPIPRTPARVLKAGKAHILMPIPRTPASQLEALSRHHSALALDLRILNTQTRARTSLDSRITLGQVGDLSVGLLRRLQACLANTVICETSKVSPDSTLDNANRVASCYECERNHGYSARR